MMTQSQVDAELRSLLEQGVSLNEAVRYLFAERQIGILWIACAVEVVAGMEGEEAKRLALQETWESHQSDETT